MKRWIVLLIALVLLLGCGIAAGETIEETGFGELVSQYGIQISDLTPENALQNPRALLSWLKEIIAEPVRSAALRLRRVLLPAALLMVMRSGMGDGNSAPLTACRLTVLIGCIGIVQPALNAAAECIRRAKTFSDSAAPILAAAVTASGMTGKAAILSPAAAMIGNICQIIYADCGLLLTRSAAGLAAAGGLCKSVNISGLIRFLKKLVNWGAGLIGTLFAALITYAGANAFARDTVAMRAAKYAFDSASGIIGGTSEIWGGSIAGFAALRSTLGFGGTIAVLAVCIQPMAEILFAIAALNVLSAALRMFGDDGIASAIDHLSGACQMALMLSGSAIAIVIVMIGSAVNTGGALL